MLNIGKTLILGAWMLGIVHVQDMCDHPVDDLGLAICLGVEGSGFGELGFHQGPKDRTKCAKETNVPILDDGFWYPKMYLHSFEEDLSSGLHCDALLQAVRITILEN
jgi:hypothetical protein